MTAVSDARVKPASPADGYTARHLSVLEGLEAVRKRPGMYIGSTDSRGLHALPVGDHRQLRSTRPWPATATAIEVVLHADGSAEVRDNGRGIPVDIEPKTGLTGVELVMTRAARRRQVRRRLLRRLRRPARRRRLGGQRAVRAAGRRGGPRRLRPGRPASAAGVPGEFDGAGPGRAVRARLRAAQGPPGGQGSPAPGSGSGRTGRSSCRDAEVAFDELHERARQTAFLVPGLAIRSP